MSKIVWGGNRGKLREKIKKGEKLKKIIGKKSKLLASFCIGGNNWALVKCSHDIAVQVLRTDLITFNKHTSHSSDIVGGWRFMFILAFVLSYHSNQKCTHNHNVWRLS